MKIRQRRKFMANSKKLESMFIDFDDGDTLQIPVFAHRDNTETISGVLRSAILYHAVGKGNKDIIDVEIDMDSKNGEIDIVWIADKKLEPCINGY